jgi:peptidoglycan-associated lipoprotein
MNRRAVWHAAFSAVMAASLFAAACGGNKPPVAKPLPPPPPPADSTTTVPRPPLPPEPVAEPVEVPREPLRDDAIRSGSIDEINRNSPLKPVFFDYDSADLSPAAKSALDENSGVLKKYGTWVLTIEGHCDERGTPEYNLALGERRAVAARTYLVALGVAADRLRTVSYGKEFPFDPGHDEPAWAKNRRAHFVITAAK